MNFKFKCEYISFSVFISYKGAPISKQIAPDQDFNPSTAIFLKGQVFDRNCQPIPNVIVDVWYAGGNPGNYIIFHFLTILIHISYPMSLPQKSVF